MKALDLCYLQPWKNELIWLSLSVPRLGPASSFSCTCVHILSCWPEGSCWKETSLTLNETVFWRCFVTRDTCKHPLQQKEPLTQRLVVTQGGDKGNSNLMECFTPSFHKPLKFDGCAFLEGVTDTSFYHAT